MKKLILYILILFAQFVYSQNVRKIAVLRRIDSLLLVKTTGNDTMIMNKLAGLSKLYIEVDEASKASEQVNLALEFISANEAKLSKQNSTISYNFHKNKASIYRCLGLLQSKNGNLVKAQASLDSAIKFDTKINYKIGIASGNETLGLILWNLGKQNLAKEKFNYALEIYSELKKSLNVATTLRSLGNLHKNMGKYADAAEYYKQSLEIFEQLKDENKVAALYLSIGINFSESGNYSSATEYFIRSMKLSEKFHDTSEIAHAYVNLAVNDNRQGNSEKCIENNTKALNLYRKLKNNSDIPLILNNLGIAYTVKKNYSKALEYYFEALNINEETGSLSMKAYILGNIGVVYQNQKDEDNALKYYLETSKILEEINNKSGIINSMLNIGIIYCQPPNALATLKYIKTRLQLSEIYMQKGFFVAKEFGSKELLVNAHSGMSQLYKAKGNASNSNAEKAVFYKKSLEHLERQMGLKDSLINEQITKQSIEMDSKYESDKKEKENKILTQENEIQKLEIDQKNFFIYGLFITVLLILMFAILLIRQNKLKTTQKTIELEQKLLRTQLNPHFIFNSLNAIQNYIYKNDSRNAGDYLSKFAILMRMILDNSRLEFISLEKEIEGLNLYLELQSLRFENRFSYAIETDKQLNNESITIPPMLAQPFIENAIEHGLLNKNEKGKITVRFLKENDAILFEVEDDGIGREKAAELKKEMNVSHKSLATIITNERLNILNKGNKKKIELKIIDLKNEDGTVRGTKVVFNIPYLEI